jgi:aminoglycoside 3-N-acetyltransferase
VTTVAHMEAAFRHLGLVGKRVVIHSSLRSFGEIEGGADALLALVRRTFETVMMPAFSFESNAAPPPYERPARNGTDYSFYEGWSKPPVPFVVERAVVDRKMGLLSQRFASSPDAHRSDHPWHSWACAGSQASEIVADHRWDTPNSPLERLTALGGHVLLLGVGLSSCTAVHIAEERAGRRPFVRWATDREGRNRQMRVAGCAKGFDALTPHCESVLARDQAGPGKLIAASLTDLIARTEALMISQPELTRCSRDCRRCADAIAGGPPDEERAG